MIWLEVYGPSGPRLLAGGPSGLLTSSFAPLAKGFGRSGCEIHADIFVNLKSSLNSGHFASSRSPVALFYFRDIATGSFNQEIQKYMNPDIRNPEIHFSFENLTSSRKSGHFAISGFPVALFVSEIWPSNIQKSLFLEIWKALENLVVLRAADLC